MDNIEERVLALVKDFIMTTTYSQADADQLTLETSIFDLTFDEYDILEFVHMIDELSLELADNALEMSDEELEKIRTVQDVVDVVKSKVAEAEAKPPITSPATLFWGAIRARQQQPKPPKSQKTPSDSTEYSYVTMFILVLILVFVFGVLGKVL